MPIMTDHPRVPQIILASTMMALCFGHALLGTRLNVGTHTFIFLLWYWVCLASGAYAVSRLVPAQSLSEIKPLKITVQVLALLAATNSILYLIAARQAVDSVDLFYFLCESRDKLWGIDSWNDVASLHFPGVYVFWKSVLSVSGGSFAAVQWAATVLLAANALVTGFIVFRMTQHATIGVLSGVLYVALSLRYEGLTGSREILCTLPYLLGTWLWLEWTEIRRRPVAGSIALGIGLGAALFCKQQAGLLAMGCVVVLLRRDLGRQHSFRIAAGTFFVTAFAAMIAFLVLILCQGEGLQPIVSGLQWAAQYKHENSWLYNMLTQIRNDESFALMVAVALFGNALIPRLSGLSNHRDYRFLCWQLLLSAAATLPQYQARGYLHYTLLAIPAVTIVFSVQLVSAWRLLSGPKAWQFQGQVIIVLLFLLPLLYNGDRPILLDVTENPARLLTKQFPVPWHEEDVPGRQLQELSTLIPPRSELYLIPSGRNAVYFFVSGINSGGYAFKEMTPAPQMDSHPPDFVILIPESSGWSQEYHFEEDSKQGLQEFISAGYEKITTTKTVEVYRRPDQ
jgi:hypothetical protein